jgi:hypothetical protein
MSEQVVPQTEEIGGEEAVPRTRRYLSPSEQTELARRRHRLMMLLIRTLFLVLLVTVTLLPFVGALTETEEFTIWDYVIPIVLMFAYGAVVVTIDVSMPNKRLASLFGIYLGIIAGLVGALAVGALLDLVAKSWDLTTNKNWLAYLGLAKLAIGITMCYLAVSIVLTTKDDFRLVIPYVEFAKQVRGIRPLLVDTSVLIDGRIDTLGQTQFLDAPLIVPSLSSMNCRHFRIPATNSSGPAAEGGLRSWASCRLTRLWMCRSTTAIFPSNPSITCCCRWRRSRIFAFLPPITTSTKSPRFMV